MDQPLDPGPVPDLGRIVSAFEALEIDYYIGGSIASSVHGIFRQTADVDFVAAIALDHVEPLTALLQAEFYIDAASVREAIDRGTSFNVIHLATMEKCDIFIHRTDAWGREQMSTRVARPALPGAVDAVWIESAACTILQKLWWYQSGGGVSDRQWRDILGMLKTGGKSLDLNYLRGWAAKLGCRRSLPAPWKTPGSHSPSRSSSRIILTHHSDMLGSPGAGGQSRTCRK